MNDNETTYSDYIEKEIKLLSKIDKQKLNAIVFMIKEAYDGDNMVFIAGNGGSAATANHFACDFGKNAVKRSAKRIRIVSLSASSSTITALGNDYAMESIFTEQLKNLMRPHDILILVSASGNSPDIVRAAEYAKSIGNKVIGLSGFDGGILDKMADIGIRVDSSLYEQVEDLHLTMLHLVTKAFIGMDL